MERKKRKNWVLPVMLVIAVTFSNVYPVTAAELPDQTVLAKVDESKKTLDSGEQKDREVYDTEINEEGQSGEGSISYIIQCPEAEDEELEDEELEDEELEDEELEDEELEGEELEDEELEDEELEGEELEDEELEGEELEDEELEDKKLEGEELEDEELEDEELEGEELEDEELEDEELEDEELEGEELEDEDLEEKLDDGFEDGLEDVSEDVLKEQTPDGEKSEDLVWVWSDKAPVLMEAEEGDDLSSQLFGMTRASEICPTYEEAYEAMIGMKDELYEGMTWTNFVPFGEEGEWGKYYRFQGGSVKGASLGVGCAAFAFMLSDEAFGNLPARTIDKGGFKYEDVKVGDILRINNNSHFVIVLRVGSGGVTVAEGNYNKSVHWGRSMSKSEVENSTFMVTRYPVGYSEEQDAEEIFQSGTEGSLSWTLTNGGTLTISGNGAMPDYTENNRPSWEAYGDKINQVMIEDGVKSIGSYAFYQSSIMGLQIPETVTSIGEAAFKESSLMEITVPGSVKVIGDKAFYDCNGLKSATFHEGVEEIGQKAFQHCGIAYLDFPASVTSVGAGAFMQCDSLVQVRFAPGEQKVSLGDSLFYDCWSLSDVTLPLKTDKISGGMLTNCSLTYLYIPAGVIVYEAGDISGSPFQGSNLKTIDFGGTESEWAANGGNLALNNAGLAGKVTVNYNVEFDDPFAEIPGDPGEFVTCEHVDEDGDGRCDICDSDLSSDPSEPEDPDAPGNDKDPVKPDDSQKPGDNENGGNTSGDNSSGSSGSNSSGSNSSGSSSSGSSSSGSSSSGSNSSGSSSSGSSSSTSSSQESSSSTSESVNKVVSTIATTNAAGETVETVKWSDGTVVMTTTGTMGAMKLEVELPKQISEAAQREDKAVTLPIDPIPVTNDITNATPITVNTNTEKQQDAANPAAAVTEPVKVVIPVTASGAGAVAVLVNPDGTTQIIEDSTLIEGGMVVLVSNGDTVKIVDRSREFTDVPADAWYKEAVDYVAARDLFYGVTETTFDPAAHMTCAMLVTALARLEGLDTEDGATWYEEGMSWAVASGVMDAGMNPESTATSDLIKIYEKYFNMTINDELPGTLTRAEAAQMLWNLKRCRP